MNWERCEPYQDDLVLIADCAEETLEKQIQVARSENQIGIPRANLLRYLQEAAEVLDFLHQKHHLVHGSIKPANIGLEHNHVKLLDWGLLHADGLSSRSWLPAELHFLAPELLRHQPGPGSDQYSLASLFVTALIGKSPFRATTFLELCQQVQTGVLDLDDLCPGDRDVIGRAMHLDPAQRFPSCHEFVKALLQVDVSAVVTAKPASKPVVHVTRPPVPAREGMITPQDVTLTKTPAPPPAVREEVANHVPTSVITSFVKSDVKKTDQHPDSSFLNLSHLAYNSTVKSRGILTPSLVIGLGGHGVGVLQQLAGLFHQQFENPTDLANVRLLAIDTDAKALPEGKETRPGVLTKDQALLCRLATPGGYLWKDMQLDQSLGWIIPEHLDRLGPDPKTSQLRSLARLAFVANYQALRDRLTKEITSILQSKSLMEAAKHTGLPVRQELTPMIYVVAGIGGATGGGSLPDLLYLTKSVLADQGWGHANIIGLFLLPAESDEDWAKANAYACVKELNHFSRDNFFSAQYGSAHDYFHATTHPIDEAFFWRLPYSEATEEVARVRKQAATWLVHDLTSTLGSLRTVSRNQAQAQITHSTPWRSNGMSTMHAVHDVLAYRAKNALLKRLVRSWLHPFEETLQEIKQDGERFLEDNQLSANSLLARFEHVAAVVLGREPADLIEEWTAPLRKGAAARPPLESIAQDILSKVEQFLVTGNGFQEAPMMHAVQHESDLVIQDINSRLPALLGRYLDMPGYRIGGSLKLGKMLIDWVSHHLDDLQEKHAHIHQEMLRAERTLTQMTGQEEVSFHPMGRQRQTSQIVQDLMEYPGWVVKEDLFARVVSVFQRVKESIAKGLKSIEPGEKALTELLRLYSERSQETMTGQARYILSGHHSLSTYVEQFLHDLPEDALIKLDHDFAECLERYQANYADACRGRGANFADLLPLLDPSIEEILDEMLPSEDAAEQLLSSPSQIVMDQLREAYREARPHITQKLGSRQGAFCLMVTPATQQATDLIQMAQSTLPQIIAAPEGPNHQVMMYRETGPLQVHEVYPQGKQAYEQSIKSPPTSPHNRFDISHWYAIEEIPAEAELDEYQEEPQFQEVPT